MTRVTSIEWKGNMLFESTPPSGNTFLMDGYTGDDPPEKGPTPLEAFVSAVGACTAMDVISILQKKRQIVHSYRVEVEGIRGPEGVFPRPYVELTVRHIVSGENIDPAALDRAIQLSDEKYCSVAATLREKPVMKSEFRIE
jgi:putative redox protein